MAQTIELVKCRRCGRAVKADLAVKGYGSTCYKQMLREKYGEWISKEQTTIFEFLEENKNEIY